MKKALRIIAAAMLILSSALISGCYDIVELDTISIVTGLGIDKADENGKVQLTVQVGKADAVGGGGQEGGEASEKAYQNLDSVDRNIVGALDKLLQDNSRTLFLHHNQVVIFGESHAKEGISDDIDALMRDLHSHLDVFVLISETNTSEIFNVEMELEKIPSVGITRMMRKKTEISEAFGVKMLELISKLSDDPCTAVLPIIKQVKEQDTTRLSIQGLAVIKDDKMVGKLTEDQAKGYAWALGKIKSGYLPVNTDKGTVELSIKPPSREMKVSFDKEGIPKIKIGIKARFIIGQIIGFDGLQLEEIIEMIQKESVNAVKDIIISCFKETQRLNADIFRFGCYLNKHHNKKWKKIKDKWDQIYPNLELELTVETQIIDTGKTSKSPKMVGGRLA